MTPAIALNRPAGNPSMRPLYLLLGVASSLAITAGVFLYGDQLRAWSSYGYLGIFLLSLIGNATVVLPMPAFLTALAGGGVLNPAAVGIVAAAGATLGELSGYLMGMGGKGVVGDKAAQRVDGWMRRYGLTTLFVLAAVPNPLFDVAGIAAGASRMPLRQFLPVTWAGKCVKFLAIAYIGAGSAWLLESVLR